MCTIADALMFIVKTPVWDGNLICVVVNGVYRFMSGSLSSRWLVRQIIFLFLSVNESKEQ